MKAVWQKRRARLGEMSMVPIKGAQLMVPGQQVQIAQPFMNLRDAEAMGQLIQTCVVFYNAIGQLAAKLV